jgi:hypothetical protein
MALSRHIKHIITDNRQGVDYELHIEYDAGTREWVVFEKGKNLRYIYPSHFATEEKLAQMYPCVEKYMKKIQFEEEISDILSEEEK